MTKLPEALIKRAYNQESFPADAESSQRPAFIMLRELYRQYSAGMIGCEDAKAIKPQILAYPACPIAERAAMLRYFCANLFERACAGDQNAQEDAQILFDDFSRLFADLLHEVA